MCVELFIWVTGIDMSEYVYCPYKRLSEQGCSSCNLLTRIAYETHSPVNGAKLALILFDDFIRKEKRMKQYLTENEFAELDEEAKMDIGNRIAEVREEAGLKQQDLAEILGLKGRKSVSKIETGENLCKIEHIYKISKELGVSADYLLFGDRKSEELREIMDFCSSLSIAELKKAKRVLSAVFE